MIYYIVCQVNNKTPDGKITDYTESAKVESYMQAIEAAIREHKSFYDKNTSCEIAIFTDEQTKNKPITPIWSTTQLISIEP